MTNQNRKYERLYLSIDTDDVRDQIRAIVDQGYYVERPSDYQLKIGMVNYYPHKGTITVDPSRRHPHKGLDALLELLEMHRAMIVTL
ncbi:MAG: hypothetical protein J0G28_07780 [Afipia sp.]|nr:hypothetical protein [Afipia sp.]